MRWGFMVKHRMWINPKGFLDYKVLRFLCEIEAVSGVGSFCKAWAAVFSVAEVGPIHYS